MYSWAIPAPVMVSEMGRNMAAQEHLWSTMVRIMLCFPMVSNLVIKSIATC